MQEGEWEGERDDDTRAVSSLGFRTVILVEVMLMRGVVRTVTWRGEWRSVWEGE